MENSHQFSTPDTPFERFKDLTRKLISVPKDELMSKLEEERNQRTTQAATQKEGG